MSYPDCGPVSAETISRQTRSFKNCAGSEASTRTPRSGRTSSQECVANAPDNHAVVYSDLERIGPGLYRLRQA